MRVCIPTHDERGLESRIFSHFGETPYLTIVDVDSGDLRVVRNPECHRDAHSCHHSDLMKAHRVDAVVCTQLGRRAFADLNAAGFALMHTADRSVAEIVKAVRAGTLQQLEERQSCGGGRRHRHRDRGDDPCVERAPTHRPFVRETPPGW